MIVVDASVFIAHFDNTDAHHQTASEWLAASGDALLGASPITLAEVLVGPARVNQLGAAQTALRTLGINEIPFGPDASVRLATLRTETKLKLPDCCVLLAAQDVQAQTVMTFDERLREQARQHGLVA